MHQVLYNIVQLPNEEGDMHIIQHLVHYDMPCDPNLVFSAFYTIAIYLFNETIHRKTLSIIAFLFLGLLCDTASYLIISNRSQSSSFPLIYVSG